MRLLALLLLSSVPLTARVNFVRDVKPILENHCVRCHGEDGAMRGIRLDRKERALMVVVKKKPDDSLLYNIVKIGAMPPGPQKLTPVQLETLRKWIAEGARWPNGVELAGKNPFLGDAWNSGREGTAQTDLACGASGVNSLMDSVPSR